MHTNKVMLVQIFWNLQICWYNDKKLAKLEFDEVDNEQLRIFEIFRN